MSKEKYNISIVVIGNVDSGKSTTLGHLVYKLGDIEKRTLDYYERELVTRGLNKSLKYSWVFDTLREER